MKKSVIGYSVFILIIGLLLIGGCVLEPLETDNNIASKLVENPSDHDIIEAEDALAGELEDLEDTEDDLNIEDLDDLEDALGDL